MRHANHHGWFATPVTWHHPRCQWGLDPQVSCAGQSDVFGPLRKVGQRTHDSMTRAPEEACDPRPPSSHFHFLPRNQQHNLPQRLKRKATKKTLSLGFSPPYTSISLCTIFSTAKCHDTAGQTWPYPDTRGLWGLWSLSQNLIMVFFRQNLSHVVKSRICFLFKKA
jgi:hypothetical protein